MKLQLLTELFHENAGTGAAGQKRILDGHGYTPLQLLAREGIQNSVDARLGKQTKVEINFKSLTSKERDNFVKETNFETVLKNIPLESRGFKDIPDPLEILTFSDYGTVGLSGVEKANVIKDPKKDRYVGLCKNMADSDPKATGGGTYGFGKNVYWSLSSLDTVFFYSRFKDKDKKAGCNERFIGASLFDPFGTKEEKRATGRAWLGKVSKDYCAPLINEDAAKKMVSLGFSSRNSDKENGTTIIITGVKEINSKEKMEQLADDILHFWWPAIYTKQLSFSMKFNDEDIEIPDVEVHEKAKFFVPLYEKIMTKERESPDIEILKNMGVPDLDARTIYQQILETVSETLGSFSAKIIDTHEAETLSDLQNRTALIRSPGMVVNYHDFNIKEAESYIGVLKSSEEMNGILAKSEPAVHNKWDAANKKLKDVEKNRVRNLLSRCKVTITRWLESKAASDEEDSQVSKHFGNLFGHLMRQPGTSQPPKPPSPISIRYGFFEQDKKSRLKASIKVNLPEKESRINIDQKWSKASQIKFEVEVVEKIDQNASRRGAAIQVEKVDLTLQREKKKETYNDLKDWPYIVQVPDEETDYTFNILTFPKSFTEQTVALTLKAELGLMNENGEFSPI